MAKKTNYGRYILSAGEIGSYTVCPEAWRLKTIAGAKRAQLGTEAAGKELHQAWASSYADVVHLSRSMKLTAALILVAIILYVLI